MDTEYIFLRIILGLDLLLSQLNPLVMSCSLSWLSSSLSLMIIVDHLGEVCWVGRLVRTGIDSQGVFGGSWLGLPGLQCTITPPHHHHQYHQCHTTTSDVVWCWCLGGPPPHHITPPPPPTSLHHQYHQHQTTRIGATIPPPTSDLHLYRMKTTRNTSSPKEKSMDVFGLGCIGL